MPKQKEIQNVFAYDVKFEEIHISDAESGRKGYFCLGCKKEMQAVKSKSDTRASYFRHDHNASPGEKKCTYSDETYRHKLAKEILQRLKRIKVPALYKYPPMDSLGQPMLIEKSKYIEADSVSLELHFFENDEGEIVWGKKVSNEEMNLLIRPDITFFNKENKPILFIEIVATHKLTEDKRLKLKRIGVDTVQVSIPKDSPENIEKTFIKTTRTKWIYNYEQEITEYVPSPVSDTDGIPPIDEEQRKLFKESFKCRTTQINNLIRTIKKCLGTQQYRRAKQGLESEIYRVERNTITNRYKLNKLESEHKKRFRGLQEGIEEEINSELRERRESIAKEQEEFRKYKIEKEEKYREYLEEHRKGVGRKLFGKYRTTEEHIDNEERELEDRYLRKRSTLEADTGTAFRTIEELESGPTRRDIVKEEAALEGIIEQKRDIERQTGEVDRKSKEVESDKEASERIIDGAKGTKERIAEEFRAKGEELEERFRKDGIEIEQKFEESHREIDTAIENGDYTGNGYSKRYKELLEDLENIQSLISVRKELRKYIQASECFKEKSYKNWNG